jgi:hypothetical protein
MSDWLGCAESAGADSVRVSDLRPVEVITTDNRDDHLDSCTSQFLDQAQSWWLSTEGQVRGDRAAPAPLRYGECGEGVAGRSPGGRGQVLTSTGDGRAELGLRRSNIDHDSSVAQEHTNLVTGQRGP